MKEYYFKNNEFIIENYDKQRVFTSFLPAIAGKNGIPMWAFYVNKGQIMSSFGVKDKNGAILEFFPAYTAYEVINRIGFRTFVKINGKTYEFFSDLSKCDVKRFMKIKKEQVSISEINYSLNLKVDVTYFTLANEPIGALVRKVKITNLSDKEVEVEVLDGLTQIFTPGVDHGVFKVMSNLQRSWMEVIGLDETKTAYYKLAASTSDSAEVKQMSVGNFYISMVNGKIVKPIVDPVAIFDYDTSYTLPIAFENKSIDQIINEKQYPYNKVLCGFTPLKKVIKGHRSIRIDSVIGQMYSYQAYKEIINRLADIKYIDEKQKENSLIINEMTKDVNTKSNDKLFDEYIESTYLDNMLRGGYPFTFKDNNDNKHIYYLFSRKHGDPERDYNWFNIENEYYSQGNGNFRDICQNRRNDSMFNVDVKDYNLKYFMNLIQLDGYNPLGVNGATFSLIDNVDVDKLVSDNFVDKNDIIKNLLKGKFTPGSIVNNVVKNNIKCKKSESEYLADILSFAKSNVEASFNEGYWCDHFTYVLDLYDSYISVFPDKIKETLFDDLTYKYFESPCLVQPRFAKTVLTPSGSVRQYGALYEHDHVKINKFNLNPHITNFAKDKNLNYVTTNLFSKFIALGFLKFNLLDVEGIGIEMEAGKPGWNDACNGLPGLFSSSVGETFEVVRIFNMINKNIERYPDENVILPKELYEFINDNVNLLKQDLSDYDYWDKACNLRENYREVLRVGVSENVIIKCEDLKESISLITLKLNKAIDKALSIHKGMIPTFISYEVVEYEKYLDENKNEKKGYNNYPLVKALKFERVELPMFLEASARALKVIKDKDYLRKLYKNIKNSEIYDKNLKMYKTSAPLDEQTHEIGRIRAFNKGWLERESNFMHMTYKYLYGLLKAGLYKEFYKEIKTNMVCNMNPKVYGRSPLEHCSFIASSNNPDEKVHGQGFVSRLSGSTAEMLSIYLLMSTGGKIFDVIDGKLTLTLRPLLKKKYFDNNNEFTFNLLSHTKVTYVNENRIDTYNGKVVSYKIIKDKKVIKEVKVIEGEEAIKLRNNEFDAIIAYIN